MIWSVVKPEKEVGDGRGKLVKNLLDLRLSGVMQAMGITPRAYLLNVTAQDIRHQLQACESCEARHRCTSDLSNASREEAFAYCPNYNRLIQLRNNYTGA